MIENTANGSGRRWSRFRIAAWTAAALLLLLPLIAMQFTNEVNWDAVDFAVLGALLVGVGGTCELVARKTSNTSCRLAAGVALVAASVLIGVNAAVGIIGSENDEANLMFGAVLGVGIIGAIIAGFRPRGMARALFAMALAQALVAVIALIAGLGSAGPIWPLDLLAATSIFAALWLISAWLFRKAAGEESRS